MWTGRGRKGMHWDGELCAESFCGDGSKLTGISGSGFSGSHSDLTNVTSDQHHAESHTIASHSDTTATGAELNELTGGGDTTLHDHDGIPFKRRERSFGRRY